MRLEVLHIAHSEMIAHLHKESFDENWSIQAFADLVGLPATFGFMAHLQDQPAGFILCQGDEVEAEIITIATSPDFRRQGLAKALLRQACEKTKRMFLEVDEMNKGAIVFYKTMGFSQIARRKNYYTHSKAPKTDALVMERKND
ncbi:Ribosomal-protein-alanine acetyltransferase [Candidatus Terasakiella magnetica]|uniref:[Ribosomal protein bS18]-alanine N-acetyltransferase n=1 Tax=Candidatus Terasakiella magnetica TaxID=1867952 RepID=A0A1C3RF37_9PROT|nr:ribosomal protein S18-alanine N-acetyltransferase [Candidatus Terasakiella magnetica]SCA55879.1 Ribosomal-protein-alanine acetyltransferase [Candidatus Terasakiella magnetica]